MSYLRRDGFAIGPFGITWLDLWEGKRGVEITWGENRCLLRVGFKDVTGILPPGEGVLDRAHPDSGSVAAGSGEERE